MIYTEFPMRNGSVLSGMTGFLSFRLLSVRALEVTRFATFSFLPASRLLMAMAIMQ